MRRAGILFVGVFSSLGFLTAADLLLSIDVIAAYPIGTVMFAGGWGVLTAWAWEH